ncbi:MAG: hypothetical protein PHC68_08160 [Syntrophorhabdaceae bacterium]|nr:hypothetical protein [Syntrophorhabdaceae bacterium]
MDTLVKLKEQWISLDMPDPSKDWSGMIACVLFVAAAAVALVAACFLVGPWS